MLKLKCIDASNVRGLEEKEIYYGFPINESAAYISRFPRKSSHTGCFQISRFEILEEIRLNENVQEIPKSKKTVNFTEVQLSLF